ncbi:MAG: hypothetical protein M1531_04230, partial [Chloroflexi bacterium]|nr:hypothetical protein [Chloroflexota bacterium]
CSGPCYNRMVAELSAREPTPLREMRVEIRETQVRVGGRLPGPLPIGAEVWGRIEVRNGTMQLVAERVYSGNLELPRVMAEPLVAWANDQFRRPLVDKNIPLSVDGVELRERLAVVRGKVPQGWRPPP